MANHPDFDKLRGDQLADFIRSLPEGQRHNGFFWAANTAVEDDLPPGEVDKVAQAGVSAGLDEAYVKRTIAEAQEDHEV
jgi:hypothetical protein